MGRIVEIIFMITQISKTGASEGWAIGNLAPRPSMQALKPSPSRQVQAEAWGLAGESFDGLSDRAHGEDKLEIRVFVRHGLWMGVHRIDRISSLDDILVGYSVSEGFWFSEGSEEVPCRQRCTKPSPASYSLLSTPHHSPSPPPAYIAKTVLFGCPHSTYWRLHNC
jgi:hypothetical protein